MYCTNDDLLSEFSTSTIEELTNGDSIDYAKLDLARANAEAIIDCFLMDRYDLPLPLPIPAVIKKISIDLAITHLYENSRLFGFLPETIVRKQENGFKLLEKIRNGEIVLTGYNSTIISNCDDERIFTDDVLDDFFYSI